MSNLLPPTEKQAIVHLYRIRFLSVVFFVTAALALGGSILLSPALILSKQTEALLVAKENSFAGKETSGLETSLTSTVGDINTRLAVFLDTAPLSPLDQSFIDPVLEAQTSSIRITQFIFTANATNPMSADVQVSGVAVDRQSLLTFSDALDKEPGVTDVLVPITSFLKSSDVTFTLTATIALK